jgi:hypothetical protein
VTAIDRFDDTPASPDDITAFVQEWLFIGLLTNVLGTVGKTVNLHDIGRRKTEDDDAQCCVMVTTPALSGYWD